MQPREETRSIVISRPALRSCLKKAPVILIGRRLNVEPSVTATSARRASRERDRDYAERETFPVLARGGPSLTHLSRLIVALSDRATFHQVRRPA